MSKMKKVLSMLLVAVLAAAIGVGSTLAYLLSEDSDVNVMTLGNVKIAQHEYQRKEKDGTYVTANIDNQNSYVLEDFEQAKPLYPIVGDPSKSGDDDEYAYAGWDTTPVRMSQVNSYGGMDVFAGKNAQDKFVTVENTGKTDAYVRTLVAIEIGSTDGSLIGTSYHMTWESKDFDDTAEGKQPLHVTIDGENYNLYEYIYAGAQLSDGSWRHGQGILPAGDTSYPNLSQVYLKSEATNEDMAAIDGNGNGTLDILVLSQAVQAEGFKDAATALDAGFGDVTAQKVQEWFASTSVPPVVSTADELTAALTAGTSVILTEDIEIEATAVAPYGNNVGFVHTGGVFDGGGNNLTVTGGSGTYAVMTYGGTIRNMAINSGVRGIVLYAPTEDVLIDNVEINGPGYAINTAEHPTVEGIDLIVTNSTLNGWTSFAGVESASFKNCSFNENTTGYWREYGYDQDYDRLVRPYVNTTFTNCTFEKSFYIDLSALGTNCTVTLENCTVDGNVLSAENYNQYVTIEDYSEATVIFKK